MPTTIITPIAAPIELASTSRGLANRAGKKIAWPSSIVSDAAMQTVRASRRLPRLVAAASSRPSGKKSSTCAVNSTPA